jgi:mono/diheme cytochrome c family protein
MRSTRILGAAFAFAMAFSAAVFAADDDADAKITFTKDILPILQQNCQSCHRPFTVGISGMVAPMSLVTYDEVRPWVKSIAKVVQSREMPPWSASEKFHGKFKNERVLSDAEIQKITRWAATGAPMGNADDAPAPLTFSKSEWYLGEPDLVVQLPEPVWVGDDVEDWQPMIQIKLTEEQLPKNRWLRGMECIPGSPVVHHIVVYAFGQGMERDRGNVGAGGNLGGLAPGAEPAFEPEGYGILLTKGTTLAVSMHYHKEPGPGTGAWDQSKIGLYFLPDETEAKNVHISPIGSVDFEIPAGHPNWEVGMARIFDRPIEIHGMLPHMHFRGAGSRYEAFYPDGTSEVLLEVPKYDYKWQHNYSFHEPKKLPAGTRVEVRMTFDNSPNNPANPDPTVPVRFGAPTTDEMAFGWMYFSYEDEQPKVATEAGVKTGASAGGQ